MRLASVMQRCSVHPYEIFDAVVNSFEREGADTSRFEGATAARTQPLARADFAFRSGNTDDAANFVCKTSARWATGRDD
jgi:hypothetical protein